MGTSRERGAEPRTGAEITVLHVDDDEAFGEMAAEFLEREDDQLAVRRAAGAAEGLDVLADTDVDCVVSDYEMPGRDGIEFLQAVREEHPDLPFILFTGKGSEEVASDAISAGATDYLQKGGGGDQYTLLANRISNYVEQARDRVERRRRTDAIETADAGIAFLGPAGRFEYVNDAFVDLCGYERGDLDGEEWTLIHPEDRREVVRGEIVPTAEREGDWSGETTCLRADGSTFPADLSLSTTDRGFICTVRDVTDRKDRVRQLEALHAATRELIAAEGRDLLAGIGAEAARDILDIPINGVYFHDPDRDVLEPAAATAEARALFGSPPTFERGEALAWEAYTAGELRVFEDVSRAPGVYNPDTPVQGQLIAPLGDHGVLIASSTDPGRFDDHTVRLARVLAANLEAALDREERDRELRRRERKLADLQHRVAELVDATSVEAVAEAAVDIVQSELDLPLAGIHLREGGRLEPVATSSAVAETLGEPPTYDREDADRSADRLNWEAFESGETLVIEDVQEHDGIDAGETPTRSGITCPLGEHGVLIVSSTEPGQISRTEVALVEVLGTVVTAALDRLDRERDLARFERIVEAAGDPVYTLDAEGRYSYVNDAMTDLLGYEEEELLGEHPSVVMDEADVAASEAVIEDLRRSADRTRGTVELELTTADGDRITCETQIALLPAPDGEFRGTVGVARDVTERTRRERELERYETIMQALPVGVFLLDEEGRIIDGNDQAAEMIGYDREHWMGESFAGLIEEGIVPESTVETYSEKVADLLSEETETEVATFETEIYPRGGDRRIVRVRFALLPHEEEFRGTVGVYQDVTEQREREAELEAKNERLEEFAGIVSHDLRNPLSVASGRLELARMDHDSENLAAVADAHERMERLIEDLLTLAREGEAVTDPEPVDLGSLAEQCWGAVSSSESDLEVRTDRAVVADPDRLRQLLENLMRNAVEHGSTSSDSQARRDAGERAGPGVTVEVGDLDGGFYVADDGAGIPAEERDRAFEAGYSTAEAGTGFGLSIVKEIADAHGWTVSLGESEAGGARFGFTGVDRP